MDPVKRGRKSYRSMRSFADDRILQLAVLHEVHGLSFSHLRAMRMGPIPILDEHVSVVCPGKLKVRHGPFYRTSPSIRQLENVTSRSQMALLASIYDHLDPLWRTHQTTDALALLQSWDIFAASLLHDLIDPDHHQNRSVPTVKGSSLTLRAHSLVIQAMIGGVVDLVQCPSCHSPFIDIGALSVAGSSWNKMPAGCPSCSALERVRRVSPTRSDVVVSLGRRKPANEPSVESAKLKVRSWTLQGDIFGPEDF